MRSIIVSTVFLCLCGSIGAQCTPEKLTWPRPHSATLFGHAVALWTDPADPKAVDIAVVGAPDRNVGAASRAGAVVIYERAKSATTWTRTELTSPGVGGGQRFGYSVAVEKGTIVVGEPWAALGAGRAWVFTRTTTGWKATMLDRTIQRSNTGANHGRTVGIHGDIVLVGGRYSTTPPKASGGVLHYAKPTNGWGSTTKVNESTVIWSPSNVRNQGFFGDALDIGPGAFRGGTHAIIGAVASPGSGQAGNHAYIFAFSFGRWILRATLKSTDISKVTWFGRSVAIDGDMVVVGEPAYTGSVAGEGAAHLYVWDKTNGWPTTPTRTFKQLTPTRNAALGQGVSAQWSGGLRRVAVGVPRFGASYGLGHVYVYDSNSTFSSWRTRRFDPGGDNEPGFVLASSGKHLLVGAPKDAQGATVRTAYLYHVGDQWVPGTTKSFDANCPGANNKKPVHTITGTIETDGVVTIGLSGAKAAQIGGMIIGLRYATPVKLDNLGMKGCLLHVQPFIMTGLITNSSGGFQLKTRIPCDYKLVGGVVATQMYSVDYGAPNWLKVATSNALETTIGGPR